MQVQTEFSIHPETRIGHVALSVASLDNEIAFYQQALGFVLRHREGNIATLGSEQTGILRLVEQPGYRRYRRVTGLYHFATLFPNQRELARAIARLFVLK